MTEIEKWERLTASCRFCGFGFVRRGNTFENERYSLQQKVFAVCDHTQTDEKQCIVI